jgi:hypothetical protein
MFMYSMYILVFLFFSSFQTNECYDRFVVCGENYIEKRDNFVKAALNQDAKRIIVLLQVNIYKFRIYYSKFPNLILGKTYRV